MGYLSCKADSSISVADPKTPVTTKKIQQFEFSDLQTATDNFSDQKLLGRGSHGLVYKAVLRNGRQVAVKRPSRASRVSRANAASSEFSNEVDNEIDILSKIQSPRLVNLIGFTNNLENRLLVVEFMSNGTLYEILHSNSRPPNWGRRIKLALQTAKAIDILHSCVPPVIHRDIKSANVLIDNSFGARLGDFGLALRVHVDDYKILSTPPAGTMGYLDPGYITPDNLSTKTDVFSFGILLLEIISGRKAIDVTYSPPSIIDWAIPLIRRGKSLSVFDSRISPPKDPLVRKQLGVIAAKCVRSCREKRPSMKEVVDCLNGLSKIVPVHSWNGFTNPCLMVETMGRPVETKDLTRFSSRVGLKDSRRVYSDLGLRFNLTDLMGGSDQEPEFLEESSGIRAKSRLGNGNLSFRSEKNERVHSRNNDKRIGLDLRRNLSVGVNSELGKAIARSSSSSRANVS